MLTLGFLLIISKPLTPVPLIKTLKKVNLTYFPTKPQWNIVILHVPTLSHSAYLMKWCFNFVFDLILDRAKQHHNMFSSVYSYSIILTVVPRKTKKKMNDNDSKEYKSCKWVHWSQLRYECGPFAAYLRGHRSIYCFYVFFFIHTSIMYKFAKTQKKIVKLQCLKSTTHTQHVSKVQLFFFCLFSILYNDWLKKSHTYTHTCVHTHTAIRWWWRGEKNVTSYVFKFYLDCIRLILHEMQQISLSKYLAFEMFIFKIKALL